MKSIICAATAATLCLNLSGCGGGNSASQASSTPSAGDETNSPPAVTATSGTTPIVITFDQVEVSSSANTLRTDLELKNNSKDPVLCDPTEFSVQLGNGSPIDSDTSAAVDCSPDSIDPGTTGKATMYFDIPGGYTGPATVLLSVDGSLVGQGTTQIH